MTLRALLLFLSVALLGSTAAANERTRLGVVIVGDGSTELADNLTEVAISKLAELGRRDLVGSRELWAGRRAPARSEPDLGTCVQNAPCLAELARDANVSELVIGVVHGSDPFDLGVSRLELESGRTQAAVRGNLAGLRSLISGLADAVGEVMTPKPAPAPRSELPAESPAEPPHLSLAMPPAPAEPAPPRTRSGHPAPNRTRDEPRSRVLPIVGFGVAGLAVATLAAAVVTASIARGTPAGDTRAEAQADLERRQTYAQMTQGLVAGGAMLAGLSTVTFVLYFR